MSAPSIFDLDDDGHSTGTVHPFCSEACRQQFLKENEGDGSTYLDPLLNVYTSFALVDKSDIHPGDDYQCEQCGKAI